MPIKDFECIKCGYELLDVLVRVQDDEDHQCPYCSAPDHHGVITPIPLTIRLGTPTFVTKGPGFDTPGVH